MRRKFEGCVVLDHVLLGGKLVARNEKLLEESKVVAVLNITSSVQNYFEDKKKFVYMRINVQDSGDEKIENYFPDAVAFITTHIGPGQRVLVHCEEGQSRSPTIVIAWMMKHFNLPLKEAYEKLLVIVGEDNIGINDGFKQQLMNWDVTLYSHKSMDFFGGRSRTPTRKYSESKITPPKENLTQSLPDTAIEHDLTSHTSSKKRKERSDSCQNFTQNKRQHLPIDNTDDVAVVEVKDNELEDANELDDNEEKMARAAEKRARESEIRAQLAEERAHKADERAHETEKRASEAEKRAEQAERRAAEAEKRAAEAEKRASKAGKRVVNFEKRATKIEKRVIEAEKLLDKKVDSGSKGNGDSQQIEPVDITPSCAHGVLFTQLEE